MIFLAHSMRSVLSAEISASKNKYELKCPPVGVLYNDTSTRRTFYISRIIDEEMKKGDLFVITGMSGAELAIRVLDIPDDDIIIPSSSPT